MVYKCCVTNCQGNSDNITDHKDTVVCEEHCPADYLKVIYYGKERPRDSDFSCKAC